MMRGNLCYGTNKEITFKIDEKHEAFNELLHTSKKNFFLRVM